MLQYVYTCDDCGKKKIVDVHGLMNPIKTITLAYNWLVIVGMDDKFYCPNCKGNH